MPNAVGAVRPLKKGLSIEPGNLPHPIPPTPCDMTPADFSHYTLTLYTLTQCVCALDSVIYVAMRKGEQGLSWQDAYRVGSQGNDETNTQTMFHPLRPSIKGWASISPLISGLLSKFRTLLLNFGSYCFQDSSSNGCSSGSQSPSALCTCSLHHCSSFNRYVTQTSKKESEKS